MSVIAVMTVSMAPDSISARSCSMVSVGGAVIHLSSSLKLVVLHRSYPLAKKAPKQRRGRITVLLHELPGTIFVPGQHCRDDRPVLGVRMADVGPVSYTHLRAHETGRNLVC